ncbi:hypothetical protein [Mycobacterium sp. NPDC050441]|uniref:hypothetical protein n=1 Tax=Mycobacterium sp. NPDC050441 TaxID=3155403 RepID=UPI0033D36F92
MVELPDGRPKLATRVALGSAFLLLVSFTTLYVVLSSDALTSNLMSGAYPSTTEAVQARGGAVLSVALAILGYGGLIRAAIICRTRLVRILSGLFGVALIGYLPAALFACATAFQ